MMTANEKATAMAAKINKHLESGGVVQVTTYLRSVVYKWFPSAAFSVAIDGQS